MEVIMVACIRLHQRDDSRLSFLSPFQPFPDAAEAEASRQVKGEASCHAQSERLRTMVSWAGWEWVEQQGALGNDQNLVSGENWAGENPCTQPSPRRYALAMNLQRASFAAEETTGR